MISKSIICGGDSLSEICSRIRDGGGVVTALECGVNGNAGYRVSYFGYRAPVVGESQEVPGCETSGVAIAAAITNEKHGTTSIEDRMAKLKSKLQTSGNLKPGKPSTPHEHARKPYKDD